MPYFTTTNDWNDATLDAEDSSVWIEESRTEHDRMEKEMQERGLKPWEYFAELQQKESANPYTSSAPYSSSQSNSRSINEDAVAFTIIGLILFVLLLFFILRFRHRFLFFLLNLSDFQKISFSSSIVSCVLLGISIWTIVDREKLGSEYFIFLRIVVCCAMVFLCFERLSAWWKTFLILTAILFNPFIQIRLDEGDTLMFFDITTISLFLFSWISLLRKANTKKRYSAKENNETDNKTHPEIRFCLRNEADDGPTKTR